MAKPPSLSGLKPDEATNPHAVAARVKRKIDFFHLPVPKGRTDDAYFAPLEKLKLRPGTALYLGLIAMRVSG